MSYANPKFGVSHQHRFTGNDAATMLLTPQAGTGAETKTHTTTMEPWNPGRAITLKKLSYQVKTAYTGTGCSLAIDVYSGTTSVGSLTVTSTAALGIATQSSDMNVAIASTGYVRLIAKSTTTASDANCAIGQISCTYQETITQ